MLLLVRNRVPNQRVLGEIAETQTSSGFPARVAYKITL